MRNWRSVSKEDWILSEVLGERRQVLLYGLGPGALIDALIEEGGQAANRGLIDLRWQKSCESPGYFRLVAKIPLARVTFDQIFNGRSGYRAQFYLSPEEGVLYNREILDRLCTAIEVSYSKQSMEVPLDLVIQSLRAPHAKLWVGNEQAAFDEAAEETLNPLRWVENNAGRGRRAPLPNDPMIDVKGAFIDPLTNDFFVDKLKIDRPLDLFNKGYT